VNLSADRILLEDALGIALASGVSVYDSLYLALAGKTGSCFVTADTRLQRKYASRFRIVDLHNWEKDLKKGGKAG
jgi:predicted nucleic acid-binding protein